VDADPRLVAGLGGQLLRRRRIHVAKFEFHNESSFYCAL
jgi:hypothetical protein